MSFPALRFKDVAGNNFPNWKGFTLADVTSFIKDGTHGTHEDTVDGEYLLLSAKNIKNGGIYYDELDRKISKGEFDSIYKNYKLLDGDVLLSVVGTIGRVAIYSSDFHNVAFQRSVAFFRFKNDSSRFIAQLFTAKQFQNDLLTNQVVSAQAGIYLGDLGKIKINLPSIAEQTKIANFLTAIDEKISFLTQKYDLLTHYKKGVMQQIFSQKLCFKDDDGQDFPEWVEATLGEIAKFRRGSFPQPYGLAKWYDDANGMPFIQVFDVDGNFKLKNTTKRSISKEAQQQSVFVKTGSILITIQGSIGRIAVTQYDAYVDRTLLLFESFKVKVNKNYFAYILFLLFEIEKEKAPGGIIKTITKEVLTDFKVFICDYEEQIKIANFLTAIDDKITATQTQLQAVKQWKQGLLQQMFV